MTLGVNFPSVLKAALLGAEWAWTKIYRDLSPSILRYLRAHGAYEPEDLLGEVFLQVVRKVQGFEGGEQAFRAWVFTIAHNRLIDEWRRGRRSPVYVAPDDLLLAAIEGGNLEEDAMRQLANERVRSIIERLSPSQRDVLFLRVIARLTVEETARALGKRPGAVKSLQARGLAAIRRELSREAVSL